MTSFWKKAGTLLGIFHYSMNYMNLSCLNWTHREGSKSDHWAVGAPGAGIMSLLDQSMLDFGRLYLSSYLILTTTQYSKGHLMLVQK